MKFFHQTCKIFSHLLIYNRPGGSFCILHPRAYSAALPTNPPECSPGIWPGVVGKGVLACHMSLHTWSSKSIRFLNCIPRQDHSSSSHQRARVMASRKLSTRPISRTTLVTKSSWHRAHATEMKRSECTARCKRSISFHFERLKSNKPKYERAKKKAITKPVPTEVHPNTAGTLQSHRNQKKRTTTTKKINRRDHPQCECVTRTNATLLFIEYLTRCMSANSKCVQGHRCLLRIFGALRGAWIAVPSTKHSPVPKAVSCLRSRLP